MYCGFTILVLITIIVQIHGRRKVPSAISPILPAYGSKFVRQESILVKKIFDDVGDSCKFIMMNEKDVIADLTDKLIVTKFNNDPENMKQIKLLQKRNNDAIDLIVDSLTQNFKLYGPVGTVKYMVTIHGIDELRLGVSTLDNKPCNSTIIKQLRNKLRDCHWSRMKDIKRIFHNLADSWELIHENLVNAFENVKNTSADTILQRVDDATVGAEKFANEFGSRLSEHILSTWTDFESCNNEVQMETKTDGLCN